MPSLAKPNQRRAAARQRVYAFESSTVSAAADNTGTASGVTNLSREQERRARQQKEARQRRERSRAVAPEHADAKLDVYSEMMGAAGLAALSGNPGIVAVAGGVTFVAASVSRCSGTRCHLTRRK